MISPLLWSLVTKSYSTLLFQHCIIYTLLPMILEIWRDDQRVMTAWRRRGNNEEVQNYPQRCSFVLHISRNLLFNWSMVWIGKMSFLSLIWNNLSNQISWGQKLHCHQEKIDVARRNSGSHSDISNLSELRYKDTSRKTSSPNISSSLVNCFKISQKHKVVQILKIYLKRTVKINQI